LETTREDAWHRKGPSIQVSTVSLDDLVRRAEIPACVGFLKIDTEGHDLAVLEGAGALTCDAISVEFWGDAHPLGKSPSSVDAMIALLRRRGYECYLALCHAGDAVVARYSTLDDVAPDSWGNIVFVKDEALYERVRQHRDWRFVLEMADAFDHLRADLHAKESTIQGLSAALAERLQLSERLERIAAERLGIIERLEHTAAERLAIMERYHVLFNESPRWKQMLAGAIGLWPKFSKNAA
jgi:hypothetical protein